ncbi:phthalate 4,5-dioxygenase reductase subunit [Glaciihabitans tibetensis]|uniref:Phthalate 4,5-dioxygenase reductase subunit n=1 Tax=Glaciihabitans tibetensis TaxID=1266600 RepID=A0A2T0VBK4_9MICO|nr:PDR/VanB family oxidoreductase [Glaciihabitans tibetensis]PRY67467.1 phthalate 4,5-dioxygenase reductase subunit [Glaciihabitans tibetensis]
MTTTRLAVRILDKRALTASVFSFTLGAIDEAGADVALPAFDVGAHITVATPGGASRSYSLNNDPADRFRYVIAVRRAPDGRGGSASLVDDTAVGDTLFISEPRNTFPLHAASRYLLIAAGIGITPIRAMLRSILAVGISDVHLVYLTRSVEETAFYDELTDPALAEFVTVYHRAEHNGVPFDFWPLVADPGESAADRRIFCCGPEALQDEIRALTMHWRPSAVHFEDFNGVSAFGELTSPFTAVWHPSGQRIAVSTQETLLDALRRENIEVPSSCESGTCGTCRIRLIAGAALHRDVVLDADEREHYLMPCVSRADAASVDAGTADARSTGERAGDAPTGEAAGHASGAEAAGDASGAEAAGDASAAGANELIVGPLDAQER